MTEKTGFGYVVGDIFHMAIYTGAFLLVKREFGFETTVLIALAILVTLATKISLHFIVVPSNKP